ncbi:MAG: threonine synthase, partial [Candidatus Nanopelagicales bacterium]
MTAQVPTQTTAALGAARALTCRECGADYPLDASYACMECFGPLEVSYEPSLVTRDEIESGPP